MSAFSDIFTRNEAKNKKDKYDLIMLQRNEATDLLKTTVDDFIGNEKKKRESLSTKPTTLEEIQNELSEDIGVRLE